MPAMGWPRPQRIFCRASANPNTSRPQPFACDCGVRKKPRLARGPKLIREIRQPQSTMTAGMRQSRTNSRDGKANKLDMAMEIAGFPRVLQARLRMAARPGPRRIKPAACSLALRGSYKLFATDCVV